MPKQTVAQKKAALLAELEKIEALEQQQEQEKLAIVGRVIMDMMDSDQGFNQQISNLLNEKITKNSEREILGFEKIKSNRGRPKTV